MFDSGDVSMKMVDKEQTCLFHWIQQFDRHTKQLIASKLQVRHKALCFEYKNATSLEEADVRYVTIWSWWYSLGAVAESAIHKLNNWFGFWHFCVK